VRTFFVTGLSDKINEDGICKYIVRSSPNKENIITNIVVMATITTGITKYITLAAVSHNDILTRVGLQSTTIQTYALAKNAKLCSTVPYPVVK
jgi:hypothetical protein